MVEVGGSVSSPMPIGTASPLPRRGCAGGQVIHSRVPLLATRIAEARVHPALLVLGPRTLWTCIPDRPSSYRPA